MRKSEVLVREKRPKKPREGHDTLPGVANTTKRKNMKRTWTAKEGVYEVVNLPLSLVWVSKPYLPAGGYSRHMLER